MRNLHFHLCIFAFMGACIPDQGRGTDSGATSTTSAGDTTTGGIASVKGDGTSTGGGAPGGSTGTTTGSPAPCTAATAVDSSSVILVANSFAPDCITVKRAASGSAKVSFTNNDSVPHQIVTAAGQPGTLDSGTLAPGGFYNGMLSAAGTFMLTCKLHPAMTMTVIVQ